MSKGIRYRKADIETAHRTSDAQARMVTRGGWILPGSGLGYYKLSPRDAAPSGRVQVGYRVIHLDSGYSPGVTVSSEKKARGMISLLRELPIDWLGTGDGVRADAGGNVYQGVRVGLLLRWINSFVDRKDPPKTLEEVISWGGEV